MKVVLLYLLLSMRAFLRYDSSCLFVAAYEDFGTSIPDSSDVSLFDANSIPDLNDQEESVAFLDSNLDAGDQENIFDGATAPLDSTLLSFLFFLLNLSIANAFPDVPISPLAAHVDIPQTSAFNVYPPPEGFEPCPQGTKYACCLDSGWYLPYPYTCVWYDYDVVHAEMKEYMCQDKYIMCCEDIVNAGISEDGRAGNEGIECEDATLSAFKAVQPEQQNQPDLLDMILKLFTYPHPLFRIPPPVTSPEGS